MGVPETLDQLENWLSEKILWFLIILFLSKLYRQ